MPTNPFDQFDAPANPFDIFDEDYAGAVHKRVEPGFLEEMGAKFKSGYQRGRAALDPVLDTLVSPDGGYDDETARGLGYRDAADMANAERARVQADRMRQSAMEDKTSTSTEQGLQEIGESDGWLDAAGNIITNPRAIAATAAESFGMFAPSMAVGAVSGPLAPLLIGGASGSLEYGATIQEVMNEHGVELTDAAQIRRALDDPELMAEARDKAAKRGVSIATFDALTVGLAGRLIATARSVGSAAVRAGGELGMQAGGGMAGEATAQLATDGQITSPSDVLMEGIAELPTSITEVPTNYRTARERFLARERQGEIDVERANAILRGEGAQDAAEREFIRNDPEQVKAEYRALAGEFGAKITSLDRTQQRNREVGGVPDSQHVRGTAGDFVVPPEQRAAFMAEARRRGYEAINEGDHIHLELPSVPRETQLEQRRQQRQSQVESGEVAPGAATAEDLLDEARSARGMPLDATERTTGSPSTPAPAAPSRRPQTPVSTQSPEELLEQHRSAVAEANDKTLTPPERRAAKKRAQYILTEIEVANSRPRSQQVEQAATEMLDQVTAPMQQAPVSTPAAPAAAPVPVSAPMQVPAQVAPVAPPAQPQEVVPEQPAVAEPAPTPVEPLVQPRNEQIEIANEARTAPAEIVRTLISRDKGLLSVVRTGKLGENGVAQLRKDEVVEVKLAPRQQRRIDQLGRVLGRRIILYDIKAPGAHAINGFIADDRNIFVNPRSSKIQGNSLVAIIGHEFLHTLRRAKNPLAAELMEYARAQVNMKSGYVNRMAQNYSALYGARGKSQEQTADMVTEELLADFIGDLLNDTAFWNELSATNPSLFEKLVKDMIDFLTRLMSRAKTLGAQDAFEDTKAMREKAVEMLRLHMEEQQNKSSTEPAAKPGDTRASVGYRDDLVKERAAQVARKMFDQGDYMSAVREADRASQQYAEPVAIDTPEKRKFFGESSRKINLSDKAAVMFHGTSKDITKFKPKTGDATFLAETPGFSGPYAAASALQQRKSGKYDVIVDGKSMREQRNESSPGSADFVVAELLLEVSGDVEAAKDRVPDYVYLDPVTEDVTGLGHGVESEVVDAFDQIIFLDEETPGFIRKIKDDSSTGMQIMPVVTNAKNPWDYQEKSHVKRLVEALRDKFRTTANMKAAMTHPHSLRDWDHLTRSLTNESSNWMLVEDRGAGIPQLIRELGYDAYFVSEEGHKNLAVFDPKSIKSATGNVGAFGTRPPTAEEAASLGMTLEEAIAAQEEGDIRLSLGSLMQSTFTNGLYNDEARAQMERWFLDEYRDLREIQKAIGQNVFGGAVPPDFDAHRNENLRHGAYQDARQRAEERFIAPIARTLSKAGTTLEAFSDYLWWRHAGERDAYLRNKLDPTIAAGVGPADLAGIDPADAAANIAALDPRTRAAFERAAKFVDGMRRFTLKTMLDSGQITQDHYDNVLQQYDFYVPFRGMPDGSERVNGQPGQPAGMSMSERALGKRAAGRKSKPDNIIEEMVRDMDNALIGVQKQRVLSSVVRLIAADPNNGIWELQPVAAERRWVNGILTVVQTNGQPQDQITFMHRGIPVKIEIRHPGLRKALMNLHQPLPQWLRHVSRITRYLSAVKTSWSPFFLLVNPVRDAGLAVMGVGAEHGMGAVREMARFYPHTYGVLMRDQRRHVAQSSDKTVALLQQYAREFASIGGKTGYTYVNDIRDQQKKLRHLIDRHAKSKGMADIMARNFGTKDAALIGRKAWQHTAHLFETVNDMAENSTRLAVYAAMRESGMSVENAAAYAKEVTVNFNRRGSLGKVFNGFYMFFNAALQGSARLVRLMGNKKFAGTMGAMFASSYALALGQMMAAGDDDDGESNYDKAITDMQAQRTLSIYLGDGRSFAVPVPYGPNIFTYAGYRMAKLHYDMSRGKNPSASKAAGDIASQMLMSMSPIDPGRGVTAFLPEMARVPAQAATNTSDFGGKIAPKIDPFDRTGNPRYHQTDVKTGQFYKVMAGAINTATGGDSYEGGMVNWTGEQVRYVAEQAGGGLGRLASESYELMENLLAGIDPEPSDVPLANVYLRGKGPARTAGTYYDNLDDYENTVADWKLAIARDDIEKQDEIIKRAPWIEGAEEDASTKVGKEAQAGSVMEAKREIDRAMKALRKEKDAILSDDSLSRLERKRQAHEIDLEITELQKDFNYEINVGRGYPAVQ